jgi:hypothetical protein
MTLISKLSILPSALLVLGALSIGCGDDDSKEETDSGTPVGDGGGGAATTSYTGTLVSILAVDTSMKITIPHTVEVLNNDTGAPLSPPVTATTSASSGEVTFPIPAEGRYALWVKGVGEGATSTYDTVIINLNSKYKDPLVRISNSGTLTLAEMRGAYTGKTDRTAVTGAVYWTKGGIRMGTIGCAKIYVDGNTGPDLTQDQRYNSSNGLPAPLDCATAADPTMCVAQTETLAAGRFYIANMTKGNHTIKVSLNNGQTFVVDEKFYVPFTRAEASSPTKAVLVQLGLEVEADTKPVVPGCATP